jgi:hypothetical protein
LGRKVADLVLQHLLILVHVIEEVTHGILGFGLRVDVAHA